jgi:hypothetical protein
MENDNWLIISILVIGIGSLFGFFATKTKGFGRFSTSTFLILVSLIVSSLFYASGKLEAQYFANIIFAVIGFAGGLFTGKEEAPSSKDQSPNNKVNQDASR